MKVRLKDIDYQATYFYLLSELRDEFSTLSLEPQTKRSHAIPVAAKLLVTLQFLVSGSFNRLWFSDRNYTALSLKVKCPLMDISFKNTLFINKVLLHSN